MVLWGCSAIVGFDFLVSAAGLSHNALLIPHLHHVLAEDDGVCHLLCRELVEDCLVVVLPVERGQRALPNDTARELINVVHEVK